MTITLVLQCETGHKKKKTGGGSRAVAVLTESRVCFKLICNISLTLYLIVFYLLSLYWENKNKNYFLLTFLYYLMHLTIWSLEYILNLMCLAAF